MMNKDTLFTPYKLGDITVANRIVMAPLTRNRAAAGFVPGPFAAEYYAQRASAGLLIAEATQISQQGQGYQDTPGIYSDAQIAGWREVTDSVHAAGGKIILQLWHVGRISHVDLQPDGGAPVAPSAIRAEVQTFVHSTFIDTSMPRALDLAELPGIIDDFRKAAANALAAGFDGVEIHGANGYLLDQFARDGANHRTDAYGGSVENRARFVLEVAAAVANEVGAGKTGIRLSPVSPINGIWSSDPQTQFDFIVKELSKLDLAFIHVIEGATGGSHDDASFDFGSLRRAFRNSYIANNGYDRKLADERLADGKADLIAFGRGFIANPDFVARLESGAPLAEIDPATLYGGGAEGYSDYPALA